MGEVVAWHDSEPVIDAKVLEVQTHVLTHAGVGIDGLKDPEAGRGAAFFINDCFHVVGKVRTDGGVFSYNERCVRRSAGFVFVATSPIASGEVCTLRWR